MRISVAPYMPILLHHNAENVAFDNLSLLDLPPYVTIYVEGKWDEILLESDLIEDSYETFRLLLELPVVEVQREKKASYIKVEPNFIVHLPEENRDSVRQQLYALFSIENSKQIFAGAKENTETLTVSSDRESVSILNFNPYNNGSSLLDLILEFVPKLQQLKHYNKDRKEGAKNISAFSAYDKNDEDYANRLLLTAFIEHSGDVDDRTYLYTYDKKNKTFVEFRPGRNKVYHGMNISLEDAKKKAPDIVRKYHK